MRIPMGPAYLSYAQAIEEEIRSVKVSNTSQAFLHSAEQALADIQAEDISPIGIVAGTAYGPLTTYLEHIEALFSRGIRGLRPQKSIHCVLCEPACQLGISKKIKAFNMSFSDGELSGFSALTGAADALINRMADTILVVGGDDSGKGSSAGAVLLGNEVRTVSSYLRASVRRFAPQVSDLPDVINGTIHALCSMAELSEMPYILSGRPVDDLPGEQILQQKADGWYDKSASSADAFYGMQTGQRLLENGQDHVLIIDVDACGQVAGFIMTKD